MSTTQHGYSGKPLYQKLGLKPGMRVLVINPPEHFDELMRGAERTFFIKVRNESINDEQVDVVHLFCANKSVVKASAINAISRISEGGMLWVSWPKKSSDLYVDLSENDLRTEILPTGWVDVKVCAVDADWSGLKFLKRKNNNVGNITLKVSSTVSCKDSPD